MVAVEPVPGDELFRLAALNQRLTIRTEALGKADADRPFAFGPGYGYAPDREGLPVYADFEVKVVHFRSLDSLIADGTVPSPDVVKIDVEGLEADVLAGMSDVLAAKPALAVECHKLDLLHKVLGILVASGYTDATVVKYPQRGPWHVLIG